MGRIRVAIAGVGNCASSLVQGIEYYSRWEGNLGLINYELGGYLPGDLEVVAAFDVDASKVGLPLNEAIFAGQNNTEVFCVSSPNKIAVQRGRTLDGIGHQLSKVITKAEGPSVDVAKVLQDRKVDVLVNLLPVGSEEATKWYAEQALAARCAFVNGIPVFIASDKSEYWPKRFARAGVPVLGDDVKSQVGATIVHRVLTKLFEDRGVRIDRTYQLNFGGNTDFRNMLDRDRLESKKISKTGAVQSQLEVPLQTQDIHVGPSDFVPWLKDRKWCHIRMEGTTFGGVPLNLELKLEVHDSPNSAGVLLDAIRYAKVALDRKLSGPIVEPSAYLFKTPPLQFSDDQSRELAAAWLENPNWLLEKP